MYVWWAVPHSMCGMFSVPAAAQVCCFGWVVNRKKRLDKVESGLSN